MFVDLNETICAPATPLGRGALAVVRLSGPHALHIARKHGSFVPERPASHTVHYGIWRSAEGEPLDEVLVTYFEAGRSFTCQETVEISCHGNPSLVNRLVRGLVDSGARLAEPGEFSYRAFANGRLDLSQAESILDLIEGSAPLAQRAALANLRGGLGAAVREARGKLLKLLAHMAADIDFSTEGLSVMNAQEALVTLRQVTRDLEPWVRSYEVGRYLRQGVRVALAGAPNAGKSSLLNCLLEEERSIVAPVPGTTRDYIEGHSQIEGVEIVWVDTAGLREAEDTVERLGVERSRAQMREADLVVLVVDASTAVDHREIQAHLADHPPERTLFVGSKHDLGRHASVAACRQELKKRGYEWVDVSSATGFGKQLVIDFVLKFIGGQKAESSARLVVNARHFTELKRALDGCHCAIAEVQGNSGWELACLPIQEAEGALGRIVGDASPEAVIDKIFNEFCLGK